jgi:SAM-dependent methyltransferase/uncharacterized protein YbaR (Trm112 family)
MDAWLLEILACPRDHTPLLLESSRLVCRDGHRYPVVDGIAVMLLDEVRQTHGAALRSLHVADRPANGASAPEMTSIAVDPYVQTAVAATNGNMYQSLVGRLSEYPIPNLNLPSAAGATLLDMGCNWGRWCIAAGRLGYSPVGIDPSLEAVGAARRVAAQLGVRAHFVVADGRFLPFRQNVFDVVFSYSVLQHFSRSDVRTTLREVRRVLRPGGRSLIQMANTWGPRCLYHQIRRGFREPSDFQVRYWAPRQLLHTFRELIGNSELTVDGSFTLNPQTTEAHLLPWRFRVLVRLSMLMRRLAGRIPWLSRVADSLYVSSQKVS